MKLLDQVIELLATYETVTVTFGASAFIFALFVAIGGARRRDAQSHKRLMTLASMLSKSKIILITMHET